MKNNHISEKILFTAYNILLDWEKNHVNLDECIDQMRLEEAEGKSAVASLLFEYFRHKGFIDRLIQDRAHKGGVKPELRALLACALTQSIFQTGIAAESAANIAVDCAKRKFGRGPGAFMNAVLRSTLKSPEVSNPPSSSFPEELRSHWETVFGEEQTTALMAVYASNPPPVFRLRGTFPEDAGPGIYRELPALDFTAPFRFYEILQPDKFFRLGWLEKGLVYVQDPATVLALSLLEAPPTGPVLDACAAPGGKSILLKDWADAAGTNLKLTAADRSAQRLKTLKINLSRAGVRAFTVQASAQENPFPDHSFDLILADVPCGNSGVLRRRCDAPWRYSARKLQEIATLQWDILNSLAKLTAPGGKLLYSTCSIEPEEDENQVTRFLENHPDFQLVRQRKLFPGPYHDGAFGALLQKKHSGEHHS
ncbi:MAG: RsmB/NOP family class I SAM-dependent RNA methyltransferase [Lentisphaeria bacterium]|nr:RsmB/NOP family class I SAM-dependent RNA methyltransferase [Lentisphaeria bacterium]